MRRLVIAEKGSAALRLAVVLSGGTFKRRRIGVTVFEFSRDGIDHSVIGLRGHIVELDYPEAFRGWELANLDALVGAEPLEKVSEPLIGDALRALAADTDEAWVCTDFDREGELIGVEALRLLGQVRSGITAKRARFSALARADIEDAFSHPAPVDEALAASARAREEIDLAWGAVLTRFLSLACGRRGRDFLSVGRVQTPTLALLVEREREIEAFVPVPYWVVTARLEGETTITATHGTDRFWRRDEADAAQGRAELAETAYVTEFAARSVEGHRPPPFNTTMFLAEATRLGLAAARAMQIAEDLYRRGLISYPRTDNTVYPPSLNVRSALERLRESDLAAEVAELLALESFHPSRGPIQATDHPPIYPTAGARHEALKGDAWRVYELVVRRFFATVAPLAQERDAVAEFDIGGESFFARWRDLVDPGWRKYYGAAPGRTSVPTLAVGDQLRPAEITNERRETEPPSRYSQGELIEAMEAKGLGTKSTRHEIVQKVYDRGYAEGRRMRVTAAGRAVAEALEAYGGAVAGAEMTATLESAMDRIASGERSAADVLKESRTLLAAVLTEMRGHEAGIARWVRTAMADEVEVGPCEKCAGTMVLRRARNGRRFLGCSNFPMCRNSHPLPSSGLVAPTEEVCAQCGAHKLARVHRGIAHVWCATPSCSDEDLARILGV